MMVSSRKQKNVDRAVKQLRSEPANLTVEGVVCHVGKSEHRKRLIKEVVLSALGSITMTSFFILFIFFPQAVSKFGSIDILVSQL